MSYIRVSYILPLEAIKSILQLVQISSSVRVVFSENVFFIQNYWLKNAKTSHSHVCDEVIHTQINHSSTLNN